MLAHSDQRTAYQFARVSASKFNGSLLFKRTHDMGATWQDVTPPASIQVVNFQDLVNPFGLEVSPLDPTTVFLTVTAPMSSCPNSSAQLPMPEVSYRSSQYCTVQYYSRDGGASWHTLTLPPNDLL